MSTNRKTAHVAADEKTSNLNDARLNIDREIYKDQYDEAPFAFGHNLHTLEIFDFESLCELAKTFDGVKSEYNLAGSAPAPGVFASSPVSRRGMTPSDAVRHLDEQPLRLLLKRPEDRDERFAKLLNLLFRQINDLSGGVHGQKIERLESSVLISSAAAITPLHFDPEIGFFSQIEGGKIYHAYAPSDVSEPDLENFYVRGQFSICRLDMEQRHPENEHVFHLEAGRGFHQPQNAPHWVETCSTRSVSYTCVFETATSRARNRTRAFNYYQRRLGFNPAQPGLNLRRDALKAELAIPELLAWKVGRRIQSKIHSN